LPLSLCSIVPEMAKAAERSPDDSSERQNGHDDETLQDPAQADNASDSKHSSSGRGKSSSERMTKRQSRVPPSERKLRIRVRMPKSESPSRSRPSDASLSSQGSPKNDSPSRSRKKRDSTPSNGEMDKADLPQGRASSTVANVKPTKAAKVKKAPTTTARNEQETPSDEANLMTSEQLDEIESLSPSSKPTNTNQQTSPENDLAPLATNVSKKLKTNPRALSTRNNKESSKSSSSPTSDAMDADDEDDELGLLVANESLSTPGMDTDEEIVESKDDVGRLAKLPEDSTAFRHESWKKLHNRDDVNAEKRAAASKAAKVMALQKATTAFSDSLTVAPSPPTPPRRRTLATTPPTLALRNQGPPPKPNVPVLTLPKKSAPGFRSIVLASKPLTGGKSSSTIPTTKGMVSVIAGAPISARIVDPVQARNVVLASKPQTATGTVSVTTRAAPADARVWPTEAVVSAAPVAVRNVPLLPRPADPMPARAAPRTKTPPTPVVPPTKSPPPTSPVPPRTADPLPAKAVPVALPDGVPRNAFLPLPRPLSTHGSSDRQPLQVTKEIIQDAIPEDASCIVHVMDRRVNFDACSSDVSYYSLLRSWVQDDPYRQIPPSGSNILECVSLPSDKRAQQSPSIPKKRRLEVTETCNVFSDMEVQEPDSAPSMVSLRDELVVKSKRLKRAKRREDKAWMKASRERLKSIGIDLPVAT